MRKIFVIKIEIEADEELVKEFLEEEREKRELLKKLKENKEERRGGKEG